jgi:hypothetical protein
MVGQRHPEPGRHTMHDTLAVDVLHPKCDFVGLKDGCHRFHEDEEGTYQFDSIWIRLGPKVANNVPVLHVRGHYKWWANTKHKKPVCTTMAFITSCGATRRRIVTHDCDEVQPRL